MKTQLDSIKYPVIIVSECGENIAVVGSSNSIINAIEEHWGIEGERLEIVNCGWSDKHLSGRLTFTNDVGSYLIETTTIYE